MASTNNKDAVTEEEIDQLTMPTAMRFCLKYKINLDGCKDLYKIKWLIKFDQLCQEKTRDQTMGPLAVSGDHDRTRREALSALYDNTIQYIDTIQKLEDPVVEELDKMFPQACKTLKQEQSKMKSDVAPVLVLGETGSGKSSFINLLLGEDILPCSLLSNTHVICEITYSGDGNKSWAKLHKAGSGGGTKDIRDIGDMAVFTKELAECIQMVDSNKRAVYNLAQVYLPCDILKCGLMIVDSPGVGETKEMTNLVLDYILNASAFIYIIDSTNAGGMQARVKDLVQKVYRKALKDEKICRPDSAIFICNKWDEVCSKERAGVWEDTIRKVKDAWPECKESQIIPFSTLEAIYIQEKGGVAPKFEIILRNINTLVPVGQEVLVLKGYRYIEQFLFRCIHCFETHLSQMNLSKEDRDKKGTETRERLHQIKSRITSFFEEQTKTLKADIETIAGKLKSFINETTNMERVCNFSDSELPKRKTWNEAAVEVRHKVYGSMRNLIKEWESSETQFGSIALHIETSIEREFPAFDREIYETERLMSSPQRTTSKATEESEIGLVPDFIQNRIRSLSRGTKVALGIGLSPVLLVSMIFRLPIYGVQAFDKFFSKYSMEKEFKEAEDDKEKLKEVYQKYAQKTVASITDKMNLKQVIEEDMQPLTMYLKQQQKRMELQIQNDLDLLESLKDEERKDEDVRKVYEPLNAKFLISRECLHHFMLMHLPSKFASWIDELPFAGIVKTDTLICAGLEADIFSARSTATALTGNNDKVCVRIVKEKIKENMMKQFLTVLEAYNTIDRENIAKCYGFWNPGVGEGKLYQVLQPLQCSLRQFAKGPDFEHNRDNNCIRTVKEIVCGLDFLHDRKLTQFDLSMDTVAIDATGTVKLTNISPERRVNLEAEVNDGKVCLSKYIYIAPKFFQNKNGVRYRTRDDMYGVGMIMWELWVGQPVVELGKEFEIPANGAGQESFKRVSSTGSTNSTGSRSSKGGSEKGSNSHRQKSGSKESFKGTTDEKVGESKRETSHKGSIRDKNDYENDDVFECEKDNEWFQNYLETYRPKQTGHFKIEDDNKRNYLAEEWWNTLDMCLNENITAKQWMDWWKDYPNFPDMSIIFPEQFVKD